MVKSSERKLMERVQHELLMINATQMLEKEKLLEVGTEQFGTLIDNILKKLGRIEKLSDDESIEETLDEVVDLLRYVNDENLFIEFYMRKLARHLISDRTSISEDHERDYFDKAEAILWWFSHFSVGGNVQGFYFSRGKSRQVGGLLV
ncbi:unnamed protein product [Dovyalis caffra]|uniref:Cullin family profile domain-containing protein n=1 Tax=Dovyalis caffra TaxID=77055 RepID=A0AAV1QNU3_9ROSI|nr:unnamed protein product [Dovyalis caffra]